MNRIERLAIVSLFACVAVAFLWLESLQLDANRSSRRMDVLYERQDQAYMKIRSLEWRADPENRHRTGEFERMEENISDLRKRVAELEGKQP